MVSTVERSAVRNIQVYNPTANTLNVRWEPATGPVQQYRVVYSPQDGSKPSESVSFLPLCQKKSYPVDKTKPHLGVKRERYIKNTRMKA